MSKKNKKQKEPKELKDKTRQSGASKRLKNKKNKVEEELSQEDQKKLNASVDKEFFMGSMGHDCDSASMQPSPLKVKIDPLHLNGLVERKKLLMSQRKEEPQSADI